MKGYDFTPLWQADQQFQFVQPQTPTTALQSLEAVLSEMYLAHKINDSVSVQQAYTRAIQIISKLKEEQEYLPL